MDKAAAAEEDEEEEEEAGSDGSVRLAAAERQPVAVPSCVRRHSSSCCWAGWLLQSSAPAHSTRVGFLLLLYGTDRAQQRLLGCGLLLLLQPWRDVCVGPARVCEM
jgi:hypothetical protein